MSTSLTPSQADDATLKELGLSAQDLAEVQELAAHIDPHDPLSITRFGRGLGTKVAEHTKSLLAQVGSQDMGLIGDKLQQVVATAEAVNTSRRFAHVPYVGALLGRIVKFKTKLLASVRTAETQIEGMLAEVLTMQDRLGEQVGELEGMYEHAKIEHRDLGLHVVAARLKCRDMAVMLQELEARPQTAESAQALADFRHTLSRLEKRATDLAVLRQSAFQTLPTIRIIQANNQQLLEKYDTISTVTVAAWRRQIALAIALEEQKDAVELAVAIDDTTNTLLRRNAELLRQNAVGAARSNQRLVIDVSTLEHVQEQIVGTVQDVLRVQREGQRTRQEAEAKLRAMEGELVRQLGHQDPRPQQLA